MATFDSGEETVDDQVVIPMADLEAEVELQHGINVREAAIEEDRYDDAIDTEYQALLEVLGEAPLELGKFESAEDAYEKFDEYFDFIGIQLEQLEELLLKQYGLKTFDWLQFDDPTTGNPLQDPMIGFKAVINAIQGRGPTAPGATKAMTWMPALKEFSNILFFMLVWASCNSRSK